MNRRAGRLSRVLASAALALALPFFAVAGLPGTARAAQSADSCTGIIQTLPALISTQGTWCLDGDVTQYFNSGPAIAISSNNVTIDCNGFSIASASGPWSYATAVGATNRTNITVRNCSFRGFHTGVIINGGGRGHLVEDNRFENEYVQSMFVVGDGSVVRRNIVIDIGGSEVQRGDSKGIGTNGNVDVIDNVVSGVRPLPHSSNASAQATGIHATNSSGTVSGNRVSGVVALGTGWSYGIYNEGTATDRAIIAGNHLLGDGTGSDRGIRCFSYDPVNPVLAKGNTISGFPIPIDDCLTSDNVILP